MFTFFLVVHAIIAAALVTVILMQRSEGGGLGMGGSPSGLMSARGAADFLTRATTILATLFVLMSIGLAAFATVERAPREIDTSLARPGGAAPATAPPLTPVAPATVPLADAPAGVAPPPPAPAPKAAAPAPKVERAAPKAANPAPKAEAQAPAPSAPLTINPPAPKAETSNGSTPPIAE